MTTKALRGLCGEPLNKAHKGKKRKCKKKNPSFNCSVRFPHILTVLPAGVGTVTGRSHRQPHRPAPLRDKSCHLQHEGGFGVKRQQECHVTDHTACSVTEQRAEVINPAGQRPLRLDFETDGHWCGGGAPSFSSPAPDTGNLPPPSRRERLYLPGSTSQFFQHDFQKDRLRRRRFRGTLTLLGAVWPALQCHSQKHCLQEAGPGGNDTTV